MVAAGQIGKNDRYAIEYIQMLLIVLKDNGSYGDFSTYQKDLIDKIDQIKNIIRNCYQNNTSYKTTSECLLSYLSIVEVNFLTEPFYHINWEKAVYDYHQGSFLLMLPEYKNTVTGVLLDKRFTPEEWMNQIKEKKLKTNEWRNTLLADLLLLEKYSGTYKFNKRGRVYVHI